MKYATALLTLALSVSALPHTKRVDENLVPQFGINPGTNPTGTGDCDGVIGPNGAPIKIPCSCPPPRAEAIAQLNANVAAGHAVNNPAAPVSFPTDGSPASQIARIQALIITLQNLRGPGQGCPAASTTLLAQQAAVHKRAEEEAHIEKRATAAQVAAKAPNLGFKSGKNPTGTGDCDGAVNGPNGKPIKIPCACPPSQADFVKALQANVAAGKAVHNPSVGVSFPLDDAPNSRRARIQAGLVTLQNLRGPGQGCPAVSSTLSAQLAAIKG